ncbi:uncharacterized protein LOC110230917 [Arabidopsis lyrata subsp. lyrata]|uniref:uncharacterized protein LOC110230917 n=1 Tax=Arabidopsis lyrata subsp. lyrata TaxID=81972 RepID=UPI000A29E65F|nr:uncharacterized protein LOC110230917 [Arabidopsis lyrata subsp. lyrata]|eukprot:XP_020890823.1 uncharacterized protein LOC110230917 [Arabidopsis lyrata subsp. lyrata]
MAGLEVTVYCYWNGCIKDSPNGIYYEGSTLRLIIVKRKTEFNGLLDQLYQVTGLDRSRSTFQIIGRYPSSVQGSMVKYKPLPVVDDTSLETMLEVPSIHPSILHVDLFLEVNSKSDRVIDPAACSSPLANPSSSWKRQKIDIPVKSERERETDRNSGSDRVVHAVDLTGDSSISNKDSNSTVSKPCMSSLWLDDHDLRVGLCFKDGGELKKAVDWCSLKGKQKCVVRETAKDEYIFECIRWKCKWSLGAARMKKHGLVEIIKYTGPHTCHPIVPEDFKSEFETDEIERAVRDKPTQTIAELKKWWKIKIGYELETSDVRVAKEKAIKRVFGDWDQSFEDLPKLMSAFCSSNGLLVDWKYDLFPNPTFASFCGVFWAFPQSIEGFQHCRPLIVVDAKNLNCEYQLKLMIASGVDAANRYFPLAFAVTKEVSTDIWRWFLTGIREKVTQRKGLCLISSPHPDIIAVINESGSQWQEPWAYHRFSLNHFYSQFSRVFPSFYLGMYIRRAGSTSQKDEFDSYINVIKEKNPEARKWLDQFPQNQWALAHDDGRRYGIMEINTKALFAVCKAFELAGHVVTGSVLLLFDELRSSFDKYFSFSRSSLNCGDVYTEPVMEKLEKFRTYFVTYIVMPVENNAFQVTTPSQKDEWIVQLSDCSCTCGEFQRYKFPCLHALAVCKKLKFNPLQYVDDCYTLERLKRTYAATFSLVPEMSAWPEASGVPRLLPPVIPPSPPPSPPTCVSGTKRRTTPPATKKKS